MNVVPTETTKRVAAAMIRDSHAEPGSDVVMTSLRYIRPDQIPALIGVLLDHNRANRKVKPLTLSEADRLRGYGQYRNGSRTPFAVTAYREYQRAHKRGQRSNGRSRMEARMAVEEAGYTNDEARAARNAYLAGDHSEWARLGSRVYYRRAKRGAFKDPAAKRESPDRDVA